LRDYGKLRTQILDYVKTYYLSHDAVPSVRKLCKHFRLDNNRLYGIFTGGQKEICTELHIPEPENAKKTSAALMARARNKAIVDVPSTINRFVLTEDQTRRFYGIAHLENSDPAATLDSVLRRDATLRRLLADPQNAATVVTLAEEAYKRGWTMLGLADALTYLSRTGLLLKDSDLVIRFTDLAENLRRRNWNLESFVEIATRRENAIFWEREYHQGRISLSQLEAKIGNDA